MACLWSSDFVRKPFSFSMCITFSLALCAWRSEISSITSGFISGMLAFMWARSLNMAMRLSPCLNPASKSLKSCAGVIFTAPVPNSLSTIASASTGILRLASGSNTSLPIYLLYRSSSGCTATAVSPSMVSGRVVATVRNALGLSAMW